MEIKKARDIAEKYLNLLRPYCYRIKIAGSIRRNKSEVKDIEIVVIPSDLINFTYEVVKLGKIKGEPIGKYTQRRLPEGINLDLFIADKENWGNIFLIRTGNWQFSKYIMGVKVKQVGLEQRKGYLWKGSERISCFEERDVFNLLGINYIEPKDRNKEVYNF